MLYTEFKREAFLPETAASTHKRRAKRHQAETVKNREGDVAADECKISWN